MRHQTEQGGEGLEGNSRPRSSSRVSRRSLLGYAGLAAGTVAVPTMIGTGRAFGNGLDGHASHSGDVFGDGAYPVGFWWPPPPAETTDRRYAEIADAGFTFVTGGNGVTDLDLSTKLLRAAGANRLHAIVEDSRITGLVDQPRDDIRDVIKQTVDDYRPFGAFRGLGIKDEPGASQFEQLGKIIKTLREVDRGVLGYANMLPTYASAAQLGVPTYPEYVAQFANTLDPELLSYDHYMLLAPRGVREDYFLNWADVRDQSLRSGIPSWVFILACEHMVYRLPTEAELRWQINVSLIYGCKGIQYFTYWTPSGSDFTQALVSKDGGLTPLYYSAQRINNDYLRPVGRQLLGLTSESATHANEDPLPDGATAFTGDDLVSDTSGDAVLLGRFTDGRHDRQRWLLVANRSFDSVARAELRLRDRVSSVSEYDPGTDCYRPLRHRNKSLSVELAAGSARLYHVHTNAHR